jgi:hypothetical protein
LRFLAKSPAQLEAMRQERRQELHHATLASAPQRVAAM